MPKWIGNRIGPNVNFTSNSNAPSGMYNMFDQYRAMRVTPNPGWKEGFSASGGTEFTPGDGNTYHVFTSNQNFVLGGDDPISVEVLFVAGGGGGGYRHGGGGGAGQAFTAPFTLSPGTYPVEVGTGGTKGTGSETPNAAADGGDTVFNSYRAGGGGGGGPSISKQPTGTLGANGRSGTPAGSGSGGGSRGGNADTGGTGSSPGGTNGGPGGFNSGGGGGGANDAGTPAPTNPDDGAPGGDGKAFPAYAAPLFPGRPAPWISAVSTTGLYAGGGGGGGNNGPRSSGGPGGGGAGNVQDAPGDAAIDGTGGGGGGGGGDNGAPGGDGGDGILIIKYTTP